MKINKLFQLGSALVISLSTLLTVSMPLAHAATSTCTWTDGGTANNDNFSNANNWSCTGTTPGNGDVYDLIFPASAAGYSPVNDIVGLSVGTVTFSGTFNTFGYQVSTSASGITATISGGITDTSTGAIGGNEIDGNLNISGNQSFTAGSGSQLIVGSSGDTINTGSSTLTLANTIIVGTLSNGGSIVVDDSLYPADIDGVQLIDASSGFSGSVTVNRGALFVEDSNSLSNASSVTVASGAFLKGNGGVAGLVVQSGGTVAPGDSPGCISTDSIDLSGTYAAELGGTTACTEYDQIQASTSVTLSGTLQVSLVNGFTPSLGQSFTLIANSGSAVSGSFTGLPDDSFFTAGGVSFQISYHGGAGNDVIITVANAPAAASNANAPGSPNTGLAAAMAHPLTTLIVTILIVSSLLGITRHLKPLKG